MKKIIGSIAVLFLFWAECTFGQSNAMPDHALEDLKGIYLNRANLSVYEEQAVLKWQDVLDYVAIIGSEKYNLEMREAALETTLANFDATAKLPCAWLLENREKSAKKNQVWCTPQQLFEVLLENPSYELEVEMGNINVQQNLHKISKDTYQGELVYKQQIKTKKNKTTNTFKEGAKEVIRIQFLLKRIDKQFGKTNEVVWEIKFSGML